MDYLFCPFQPTPHADNGGCAILPPGWIHPRRKLDSSVIILGRKGNVLIDEEGDLLEVKPNHLVLLTAGRTHHGVKPIESQASYYWFHFTLTNEPVIFSSEEIAPILSNQCVAWQRLSEAALIPQQLDLEDTDRITLLFRELLNEQEQPCYTKRRFQLLFQNLLIELTKETISSYQPVGSLTAGSSLVYEVVSILILIFRSQSFRQNILPNKTYPDYIGRQILSRHGMSTGIHLTTADPNSPNDYCGKS